MTTDMSSQPPLPELWQALDEAAHEYVPPPFPHDQIRHRGRTIKRRRGWAAAALGAALLVPVSVAVASLSESAPSHTVTSADPAPSHSLSGHDAPSRDPKARIVRPGERVQAGLGVWYLLKPREICDAAPGHEKPTCVGYLDVNQPGAVPMTMNMHPLPQGVVYVLAYTGKTPAARITMTDKGRTTELPIVRLGGKPAYVSSYAVGAPRDASMDKEGALRLNGPVFRVYDAHGRKVAEMQGW
ncbi:hypothetical protein OG226_03070 [Streptomyces sp. NBC_01261]|uniref:hypothetical protein n=1 Tax=Streptomyces sp. NBC_01261 TaxID=2903802 RepID=UPI002E37AB7C|nr:hypothetical protein [Streptomyces sp. NBC_01261]